MNKHFDHYFPPSSYNPLDLIPIDNEHTVITRLRFDAARNSYIHASTVLGNTNTYSQFTPDDGMVVASITVPASKMIEIVRQCNSEHAAACLVGPTKVYITQGSTLVGEEGFVRERSAIDNPDTMQTLASELVDCQRKLIVRLYSEKMFNHFEFRARKYRDIPISTYLEYPNFLRYQSMIVPYGLDLTDAGTLTLSSSSLDSPLPYPDLLNAIKASSYGGVLQGPCIIADTTQTGVYYRSIPPPDPIRDDGPFERARLTPADLKQITSAFVPPDLVTVSGKRVKVRVTLSHRMYNQLRPLLGMYLASECLGRGYTSILSDDSPWKIDEGHVTRIVLTWLIKTGGDYSYIAPIYNNPRYHQSCARALSIYSKKTQYQ